MNETQPDSSLKRAFLLVKKKSAGHWVISALTSRYSMADQTDAFEDDLPNSSPAQTADECTDRNPSPPSCLLENEKMVADTIPNTIISKKWALQTLLDAVEASKKQPEQSVEQGDNMAHLELDEGLETELCKLWDMSMGSAVAKYLMEVNAPATLIGIVTKSRAPRLTEICIGILGNLMCIPEICQLLSADNDLKRMVLVLLDFPDPPTLVETTRLLNVCISTRPACTAWLEAIKADQSILGKLSFILESSTNFHLLKNVADLLDSLLDNDEQLCANWSGRELVAGVLEALKQVGGSLPDVRDTYCHILQIISTSSEGSRAIAHHADTVLKLIKQHVGRICDDDFVDIGGLQCGLASAVAIVISVCNEGKGRQFLERETKFLQHLLRLVSVIHCDRKRREDEREAQHTTTLDDDKLRVSCSLTSILLETLLSFWCHLIQDMALPPFVLDALDKSPEKDVQALLKEMETLSSENFDYLGYLQNRVQDSSQYNRLAELVSSK